MAEGLPSIINDLQDKREAIVRQGKVTAVAAGPPRSATVLVAGATLAGVRCMDHVDLVVNEGVYILDLGPGRWIIIGSNSSVQTGGARWQGSSYFGGTVNMNAANGVQIQWNNTGVAAPAFTTRSVGTKLVLYPSLTGSAADYAIGIDSGTLWSSVPDSASFFKWYGGTTVAATLTSAGALTTTGAISATSLSASGSISGASLNVTATGVIGSGSDPLPYGLQVINGTAGNDAFMSLHVSGDFAGYFGMGGAENDLIVGGWSYGNVRNRIFHSGNVSGFFPTFTGVSASYAGSTTASGDASIRASANGSRTGVSIFSSAATAAQDPFLAFYDAANGASAVGSIFSPASSATTTYATTSDYRLKRDDVRLTGSLAKILALRPISFYWKFPDSPMEQGFFAHEVKAIFPTAAFGEKDAVDQDGNIITQQMELSRLVPALVDAVQELALKVQVLEGLLNIP